MSIKKRIGKILLSYNVDTTIGHVLSFLKSGDTIIDLGAGTCDITNILLEKGYSVTPVETKSRSRHPEIVPVVYDGKRIPFKNDKFDVCILIAVLHHTPDPEVVLKEAIRVSKKIIIYEDAVTNIFQRYYTYLLDSYFNRELIAPHTNKTDKEWRVLFKKLRLKLVKVTYEKTWLFFQNPTYFLKK